LLINTYLIPESLVDLWRTLYKDSQHHHAEILLSLSKGSKCNSERKKTAKIREKNN
jgi:hypothetical protein